jgi:hypothetical protein
MIAVQGPKARAKRSGRCCPNAVRPAKPEAVFCRRVGDYLIATHRLHRRGRLRNHPARRARPKRPGKRCRRRRQALRARRARHAAPRSGNESLRPGHGRDGLATRRRPGVDRRPRRRRATSSARQCAARQEPQQQQFLGLLLKTSGVLRAIRRSFTAHGRAKSPAAASRRRCSNRSPWPACRWRRDRRHVEVDSRQAARGDGRQALLCAQRQGSSFISRLTTRPACTRRSKLNRIRMRNAAHSSGEEKT